MDKEQQGVTPQENENWLDDILGLEPQMKELGPDELAVQAAGLTHPDDLELEKILSEDWDSVPDLDDLQNPPQAEEEIPQEPYEEFTEIPEDADLEPLSEESVEESISKEVTQYFPAVEDTQVIPQQEAAPAEEVPVENEDAPIKVRKVRPLPKKGSGLFGIPHFLSAMIWMAVILMVGLTLGRTGWLCLSDLFAFGKPDQQVIIEITEEEVRKLPDGTVDVDIDAIAQKLKDADMIEYPILFKFFASTLTSKAERIEPGVYTLNTLFDYNAITNNLRSLYSSRKEVELMIPEGSTCAQIFTLLEQNNICSVADMEAYMVQIGEDGLDGEYALSGYWFLEGSPAADKYWLEGFLFPDTYRFYENDDPANVVKKFLDGFDYRFTDLMHNKLDAIKTNTGLDLSIREVVIIASLIEKETADVDEGYTVSSVIYNRLRNSSSFPYLNIDATIIYALNGNIDPETGLTKPLTSNDMKLDHPYNTYLYRGLPPGAIANPGRNSIDAALSPENTNYFYYVLNPETDSHIFASTLEEHEKNVAYVNSLD
ncbi:MAG: endolytic transglycosylase MltG [Oscillospiraceae bacterium]|nr:endolytic transglycosylase MltG [Oscillospiraceae bacterium]